VNGLPLVVMELKSPTNEGVGEDDAYNQIKAYQKQIPCLFVYNAFNVISDMLTTRAGTITAKQSRYMEWKTQDGEYETISVADYATFFRGMFDQERLLDLIRNFICFDKNEGNISKILGAYHQYFAVNKALNRTYNAIEGNGKIGVFWHTQGSGKSLSMLFYTHLLIKHFAESTIVVVTDRKDLDQQLFAQFGRCKDFLRTEPVNVSSRTELIYLLKNRQSGGIIFTTIQKFEESEEPLSLRKNIIVMTDEAHRSQYGTEEWDAKAQKMKKGQALKMREALPNASFIGFTGTPISNRDKDTTEVFGDYIDIYDMTQAVGDGATRPVYYESRAIHLKIDEDVMKQLDAEFEDLVRLGATDEQVQRTQKEMSSLEKVLSDDNTIDSLVRDIITHYEENRADHLTGKAMIVALTRGVGIKIYKKMLELRPEWTEKVKVVMTLNNKDPEDWHEIIGTEANKKELARKFKDNNDPMKIAIVRDMWLTGFDVPSLATMYVFKAMSGHNLMQAIARVNRVFPEKEGGLIVDYIGIAQALKQAMNDYTKRDQQKFGNPDITKTALVKFNEEMSICRDLLHGCKYDGFFSELDADKAKTLTTALNFMLAPEREVKRKHFIEHSGLIHRAQTLCRSQLGRKEKLEAAFFDALRVMIGRFIMNNGPKITRHEINERISNLLKQSIKSEGVVNLFGDMKMEFSLFDEQFMNEVRRMKEKNIALELLKSLLKDKVTQLKRVNVVQSEAFSTMMTESLNRYIKGMMTNEEVIEELLKLAKEIQREEEAGNELGLNVEEKAFYDALTKPQAVRDFYENDQLVALTRELTEAIRKNRTIDWNRKESSRAQMRIMIKRLLKKYKYPPEGTQEAVDIVMAQCNHWAENEENFV
ncbi:MAG: type I restriction endonuclease subunit R, partial [Bacteroides sp.]|nr:type I restriction endonuclease subunit R [Bacteroides sp.]